MARDIFKDSLSRPQMHSKFSEFKIKSGIKEFERESEESRNSRRDSVNDFVKSNSGFFSGSGDMRGYVKSLGNPLTPEQVESSYSQCLALSHWNDESVQRYVERLMPYMDATLASNDRYAQCLLTGVAECYRAEKNGVSSDKIDSMVDILGESMKKAQSREDVDDALKRMSLNRHDFEDGRSIQQVEYINKAEPAARNAIVYWMSAYDFNPEYMDEIGLPTMHVTHGLSPFDKQRLENAYLQLKEKEKQVESEKTLDESFGEDKVIGYDGKLLSQEEAAAHHEHIMKVMNGEPVHSKQDTTETQNEESNPSSKVADTTEKESESHDGLLTKDEILDALEEAYKIPDNKKQYERREEHAPKLIIGDKLIPEGEAFEDGNRASSFDRLKGQYLYISNRGQDFNRDSVIGQEHMLEYLDKCKLPVAMTEYTDDDGKVRTGSDLHPKLLEVANTRFYNDTYDVPFDGPDYVQYHELGASDRLTQQVYDRNVALSHWNDPELQQFKEGIQSNLMGHELSDEAHMCHMLSSFAECYYAKSHGVSDEKIQSMIEFAADKPASYMATNMSLNRRSYESGYTIDQVQFLEEHTSMSVKRAGDFGSRFAAEAYLAERPFDRTAISAIGNARTSSEASHLAKSYIKYNDGPKDEPVVLDGVDIVTRVHPEEGPVSLARFKDVYADGGYNYIEMTNVTESDTEPGKYKGSIKLNDKGQVELTNGKGEVIDVHGNPQEVGKMFAEDNDMAFAYGFSTDMQPVSFDASKLTAAPVVSQSVAPKSEAPKQVKGFKQSEVENSDEEFDGNAAQPGVKKLEKPVPATESEPLPNVEKPLENSDLSPAEDTNEQSVQTTDLAVLPETKSMTIDNVRISPLETKNGTILYTARIPYEGSPTGYANVFVNPPAKDCNEYQTAEIKADAEGNARLWYTDENGKAVKLKESQEDVQSKVQQRREFLQQSYQTDSVQPTSSRDEYGLDANNKKYGVLAENSFFKKIYNDNKNLSNDGPGMG